MSSGVTLQELKRLFDFLKQSKTNDEMTIFITNDMCKSLYDLMDNCFKYQEKLQSNWNSLREWLKIIPNAYMDNRSFNEGVYKQRGMEYLRKMVLDKMNELEGEDSNE